MLLPRQRERADVRDDDQIGQRSAAMLKKSAKPQKCTSKQSNMDLAQFTADGHEYPQGRKNAAIRLQWLDCGGHLGAKKAVLQLISRLSNQLYAGKNPSIAGFAW